MITRGKFIASGAALAAVRPFAAIGGEGVPPNLRIGVLSDPHMKGEGTDGPLEKALRAFDRMKVDAVACCGDLATSGLVPELERVGAVWGQGGCQGSAGCSRGNAEAGCIHHLEPPGMA